jgi:hypothetical protein
MVSCFSRHHLLLSLNVEIVKTSFFGKYSAQRPEVASLGPSPHSGVQQEASYCTKFRERHFNGSILRLASHDDEADYATHGSNLLSKTQDLQERRLQAKALTSSGKHSTDFTTQAVPCRTS